MLGSTFCPLGDAAAMPTISIVKKWRNEFEEHLHGKCAYKPAEGFCGGALGSGMADLKKILVQGLTGKVTRAGRHAGD